MTADLGITVQGHAPEKTYVYRNEVGLPVGAVARFAPGTLETAKTFRQFRYCDGVFRAGLDGLVLPIYRLPEVLNAVLEGQAIFVVEGEACVEAAVQLGLQATTNAGGAGRWLQKHTFTLKGADVVVFPDHDDPGHRHARLVADDLLRLALRVRVPELPGLQEGGDIVDWLRSGGSRDELEKLVAACPNWEPEVIGGKPWATPTPFSVQSRATHFPVETGLPLCLTGLVVEVARAVKIDVTFPAVMAPITGSAAAGNAFSVRVSDAHAEPNLARYAAIFADAGERKSAMFRHVNQPLSEWQKSKEPEFQKQLASCKSDAHFWIARARTADTKGSRVKTEREVEECREQALQAREKIPPPPRSPLLLIGDVTPQMLVRMMHESGGGFAVMSADGRHVVEAILGQYRKDNSTDDSVFLRAHAGDCIDRARVGVDGQGELRVMEHPSLGLGLCLQPDKLRAVGSDPRLFESGMLQRLGMSFPRSLVGTRIESGDEQPIDAVESGRWSRIIRNIAQARWERLPTPGGKLKILELHLDPEAMVLRRAFANEIEERQAPGGDLHHARGFASKAAGEAARLASLFHLMEMADGMGLQEESAIPAPTWRIAETHQRWQLDETLRCLAIALETAEHTTARRVLEWASRHSHLPFITARDLVGARIFVTAESAAPTLSLLTAMNWLRRIDDSRQGGARWEVHPKVMQAGPS